jgi:hypothetical protein
MELHGTEGHTVLFKDEQRTRLRAPVGVLEQIAWAQSTLGAATSCRRPGVPYLGKGGTEQTSSTRAAELPRSWRSS